MRLDQNQRDKLMERLMMEEKNNEALWRLNFLQIQKLLKFKQATLEVELILKMGKYGFGEDTFM